MRKSTRPRPGVLYKPRFQEFWAKPEANELISFHFERRCSPAALLCCDRPTFCQRQEAHTGLQSWWVSLVH